MSADAFRVSAHTEQREMTGSLWSGLQILWCKLTHRAPLFVQSAHSSGSHSTIVFYPLRTPRSRSEEPYRLVVSRPT